jgi:pimeloyl-ACP methyl ester carboxylesterase
MNSRGPSFRRRIVTALIVAALMGVVFMAGWFALLRRENSAASNRWLSAPPAQGRMVDLGAYSLYCVIRGSGKPVVAVLTDLGSASPEWWHIQERLAASTTVVTYDRAGYGWSGRPDSPRTAEAAARDLEELLSRCGLKGPFILLGHGLGALYAQYFALTRQRQTEALVLVTPMTADFPRLKKELDPVMYNNLLDRTAGIKIASVLARWGVLRRFNATPYINVPADILPHVVEQYSLSTSYATMLDEYARSLKQSIAQVTAAGRYSIRPVTVVHHASDRFRNELMALSLSYDEAARVEGIYEDMGRALVGASVSGRMLSSNKASRDLHFNDPELIVRAVGDALSRAR